MFRKKTGILLIVLSVTLLGLLWLQYYWIDFSFREKSSAFDTHMNKVIAEAVDEVEESFYCIDFFSEAKNVIRTCSPAGLFSLFETSIRTLKVELAASASPTTRGLGAGGPARCTPVGPLRRAGARPPTPPASTWTLPR